MEIDKPIIKLIGKTKHSTTSQTILYKNKAEWDTLTNTKINHKTTFNEAIY